MAVLELALELAPRAPIDIIDVRARAAASFGGAFDEYARCLYCSLHTTAGFLDESLVGGLNGHRKGIGDYIGFLRALFPEAAGYRHDDLELREELPEDQRQIEPINGHSHLAFIAGGLHACVSYSQQQTTPVCLIDFDGLNRGEPRRRVTRLLGYDREVDVARMRIAVPVSKHPVEVVNLKDERLGLYSQITAFVAEHGITRGRVRLDMPTDEEHAGLTINEYETLLMRHDLIDVLRNPLRFATDRARGMLNDPLAVPLKVLDYAKYDLVQTVNQVVDALSLGQSSVEWLLSRAMALPVSRFLRTRRSVSMLVSDAQSPGRGAVIEGTYQSPILLQWRSAAAGQRMVDVTLTHFE